VDPKSKSIRTWKSIFTDCKQYPVISRVIGGAFGALNCTPNLVSSSGLWIRSPGPIGRSIGRLTGRTHLSGTVETLVGGDPLVGDD
jgi:hypothetical protein